MALQGTCREVGDVAILDFSGKITLGEGSSTLRRMVRELITKGHRKILMDLGDVDYIDSSGIGEMVAAYTTVRSAQGELQNCAAYQARPRHSADHAPLHRFRRAAFDEAGALRSFRDVK